MHLIPKSPSSYRADADVLVLNLHNTIGRMETFETYQTPLSRLEILVYTVTGTRVQFMEQPLCQQRDVLPVFLGGEYRGSASEGEFNI